MKLIFEGTQESIKKEMLDYLSQFEDEVVSDSYMDLFERCVAQDALTVNELKEYCKTNGIYYNDIRSEILKHTKVGAVPEIKEDGSRTSVRRFKNIRFK